MSLGEYIKTPNTVGLWHFNGNANDDSGNALHGSNINTVIYSKANGKFNEGAGGFYSNSSVIRVEDNNLLDLTTFTISLWFKVSEFTTGGAIFAKFRAASANDINYYLDTAGGSNRLRWLFSPNGGFSATTITRSLSINTCYNVIVTAGSGVVKIYINSEFVQQITYTGTILTNAHPLIFGGRLSSSGVAYDAYLDGCIDEAIIENIIWDQTQIQKYYTQSLGRYAAI